MCFFESFFNEFQKPNLPKETKEIRVKLKFVVEKDGSFTDIQIIEDKFNVGEEAVRVLKMKPKWKLAEFENKIVRMYFILPIKIMLD